MKIRALTPALIPIALALAGCGTHAASTSSPASSPAAAAPAAAMPAAQPETAAGAKAAAQSYFALYAAGQYAAVYPMIDAQARAAIPEATWVTVHRDCKSTASGMSYAVGAPTLAGATAVMSVSISGALSKLGSEEETFLYQGGKWVWDETVLTSWKGTPAQILAAFKAAGKCS
jgi:hypothetical protein